MKTYLVLSVALLVISCSRQASDTESIIRHVRNITIGSDQDLVDVSFELRNPFDSTLKLGSPEASCSCVKVYDWPLAISPGATAAVRATVSVPASRDKEKQLILTRSFNGPIFALEIEIQRAKDIMISPGAVVGSRATIQDATVRFSFGDTFKASRLTARLGDVEVTKQLSPGASCTISLRDFPIPARSGVYAVAIIVERSDGDAIRRIVPVYVME